MSIVRDFGDSEIDSEITQTQKIGSFIADYVQKKIFFEVIAFYIILTITVGMCISNASDYLQRDN